MKYLCLVFIWIMVLLFISSQVKAGECLIRNDQTGATCRGICAPDGRAIQCMGGGMPNEQWAQPMQTYRQPQPRPQMMPRNRPMTCSDYTKANGYYSAPVYCQQQEEYRRTGCPPNQQAFGFNCMARPTITNSNGRGGRRR